MAPPAIYVVSIQTEYETNLSICQYKYKKIDEGGAYQGWNVIFMKHLDKLSVGESCECYSRNMFASIYYISRKTDAHMFCTLSCFRYTLRPY